MAYELLRDDELNVLRRSADLARLRARSLNDPHRECLHEVAQRMDQWCNDGRAPAGLVRSLRIVIAMREGR